MSISAPLAVTMMIGTVERARIDAADVDPRHLGQHQVEQDEVGRHLVEELQRLLPVAGHGHLESLVAEADDQRVDEGLLVLGQQDADRAGRPAAGPVRAHGGHGARSAGAAGRG